MVPRPTAEDDRKPEYNDGIRGALTTAIDWGSRLPGRAPLTGKPVAIIGASPSQMGTARAQLHLRQLLERFSRWIARERAAVEAEREYTGRQPARR
jgi:NAD(P)H-dependent FMN reductase